MNSSAINIGMKALWLYVGLNSFKHFPGSGTTRWYIGSDLISLGNSTLFSIVFDTFIIPPVVGIRFSYIFTNMLLSFIFLIVDILLRVKGNHEIVIIFIFWYVKMLVTLPKYLLVICISFFYKLFVQFISSFTVQVNWFLCV